MDNQESSGKQATIDGRAHEHIVLGILMKRYHNVFLSDLSLASYDIIIMRKLGNQEDAIRIQVKTAQKSVSFTGGTRGGVDREYKSEIKEYTQSTETSDVVVGIHPLENGSFDLYFVPTILIEHLTQKSISLNKISFLKNNYQMLENCKNVNFVLDKCRDYNILT